jgi:multiple sugar transport system ATP-binding protein
MSAVHVQNLDIVLGGNPILKNLSIEVGDGEFLVLLGPSGCGKSTLLHAIAGFYDVDGGSIRIGDHDVTWADPKDRGIGMVFQSYALYPTMNVERNMTFGVRVAGVPADEIARRLERTAEMLHLTELLKRRPVQLSGGQRQRVAIGRALVREAEVYLFDEPLSNLDAKLRAELRRELKQLHQTIHATMIYVTHDQVEAMTLADRIAVMKQGVIQQIGTPDEIYNRPANLFVAGFLGSPTMNTIRGRLSGDAGRVGFSGGDGLNTPLDGLRLDAAPPNGREVVLGVRPEQVRLARDVAAATPMSGRVTLVEPLGMQKVVWFDVGGQNLSAITDAHWEVHAGDATAVGFDATRASLFDTLTEARL